MTDSENKRSISWHEIGIFILAPLSIFGSLVVGRRLGYESAELAGYAMGPLLATCVIVAISQIFKSARTKQASVKIAFYTLLIFLLGTLGNAGGANLTTISTEIDPESFAIDDAQAHVLALQIQDAVSGGRAEDLKELFDAEYFMKKALTGRDTSSRYVRDLARGAGKSLTKPLIFEQMASFVQQDGGFFFVKLYRKGQEPIVQFRLRENTGNLHYLDAYIFKAADGQLRIGDLHYYNSGEPISVQIIENSLAQESPQLENAVKLAQQGKLEEAFNAIESLSDDLKQNKMIARLRIRMAYQVDLARAEQLLTEFKKQFPDDPTIVFAAYTAAVGRDDIDRVVSLIDDIYEAVGGDDFLLWYKARLLAEQKQYKKVTALLSEMETKQNIDVLCCMLDHFPSEFLTSKEYKAWLAGHAGNRTL